MENLLEQKIISRIKAEGRITFEAFMDMALYDPEFGYYMGAGLAIGKAGDFYTSAHLHPVFGCMLGKQMEEMWEFMGRPEEFLVVEIGGGEGHICGDMLGSLRGTPFYRAVGYCIVEINPVMRAKQEQLLKVFEDKVRWVRSLSEAGRVRGCIFSNELLDAFPVHLVEMGDELREVYVSAGEQGLFEETGPLSTPALEGYLSEFVVRPERGYRTEINLRARDWLRDASGSLEEGFLLTIDYGYNTRDYYSEDRDRGTLICYHRHQANEDPLRHIGEQDITCHVNFSALKKWGEDLGLSTVGFSSQGAYLVSLGIDVEIAKLAETSKDYPFELGRIKKLIMPQGMGDSHMVLIQYRGAGVPGLRGFSLRNQMRYL